MKGIIYQTAAGWFFVVAFASKDFAWPMNDMPTPRVLHHGEPAALSHSGRVMVDREMERHNETWEYAIGPISVWSYAGRIDPRQPSTERP